MFPTKYLLDHIEALLRLSHDVKDRAVSAKLREMADEFRIMVSVADITDLAAELSQKAEPLATGPIGARPVSTGALGRDDALDQASQLCRMRYAASSFALVCSRAGAP
jgi:hypothetical protein